MIGMLLKEIKIQWTTLDIRSKDKNKNLLLLFTVETHLMNKPPLCYQTTKAWCGYNQNAVNFEF